MKLPTDETLASEARRVLGDEMQSVEDLAHGTKLTATRRVCRVRSASGAAIVKVIAVGSKDGASHDEERLDFQLREPMLYERGLPRAFLDARVEMPALLGRFDRDDEVALWLEDLDGASGSALSPSSYARIARRLGRAQGRLVPGDTSDAYPWSRRFLPDYLASWSDAPWEMLVDDDAWAAPLVAAKFSAQDRRNLVRLC